MQSENSPARDKLEHLVQLMDAGDFELCKSELIREVDEIENDSNRDEKAKISANLNTCEVFTNALITWFWNRDVGRVNALSIAMTLASRGRFIGNRLSQWLLHRLFDVAVALYRDGFHDESKRLLELCVRSQMNAFGAAATNQTIELFGLKTGLNTDYLAKLKKH